MHRSARYPEFEQLGHGVVLYESEVEAWWLGLGFGCRIARANNGELDGS